MVVSLNLWLRFNGCCQPFLYVALFIYIHSCILYFDLIKIFLRILFSIRLSYLYYQVALYFFVWLTVCLSARPSVCLSACPPVHPSVYLSVRPCVFLSLSVCLYVYLSVYLSICLPVSLSIFLSVYKDFIPNHKKNYFQEKNHFYSTFELCIFNVFFVDYYERELPCYCKGYINKVDNIHKSESHKSDCQTPKHQQIQSIKALHFQHFLVSKNSVRN